MSADKAFRILIVDDQREVARVLRTSLELLDRGYHIIDVPSGEEAILESGPFNLVVADFRLPGMSGLDLIERMRKKNADLKSIVITGYDLETVADRVDKLGVLKVFTKPIETAEFTGTVEEALHGSKAGAARADTLSIKLGEIPALDEGPVGLVLSAMRADLGADAVVLVDRKGRVVQQHGSLSENLRFSELAVLLAGNFTTTGEISTYLGDDPPAALHFYDGGNYDIYSLALGLHFFVAIVFPEGSERQMGAVVRFGTRAASELMAMVGGVGAMPKQKDEKKPAEEKKPEEAVKEESTEPEAEPEPVAGVEEEEAEPVEVTAPENIDLDVLEAAMKTAAAEDADAFWDTAVEAETAASESGKAISLEEAIELGLVPKDLGS